MNNKTILIIAVLVIAVGAYFYKQKQDNTTEIKLGNTEIEITKPTE